MTCNHLSAFLFLALASLLSGARPAQAAQSYDNCTGFIATLPAVISTQGTWCLNKDLATSITTGVAIEVSANNVTIDCNDFKLGGLAAGVGTQTSGIHSSTQQNTTIRHCNIRGFYRGTYLSETGGGGNIVEDNRFDGNTWVGTEVRGDGSTIRRNRIFDTGGTTVPPAPSLDAILPIFAFDSVDIIDNTVSGSIAGSGTDFTVFGIYVAGNEGGTVSGNRVRNLVKDGLGQIVAVYVSDGIRVALRDNDLAGDASSGSYGFLCTNNTARLRDNNIYGFSTGITSCSDVSGNDVSLSP